MPWPKGKSRNGYKPGGRPKGSKNKNDFRFQKFYKGLCRRILSQPEVEEFLFNVATGRPISKVSEEYYDQKAKRLKKLTRLVYADAKLRVDTIRDLRDGSGCKPILLLDGSEKGDANRNGKPSFNIAISVVDT